MLTALFFTVLCAVCIYAAKKGGCAERFTAALLAGVWLNCFLLDIVTNWTVTPVMYAGLDLVALLWLFTFQKHFDGRNWQWITAGLFTLMMAVHFAFWMSAGGTPFPVASAAYRHTLTGFAYLQLLTLAYITWEHSRDRAGRERSWVNRWAFSDSWVYRGRNHHDDHAQAR